MLVSLLSITDSKDRHFLIELYENYCHDMYIAAYGILNDSQLAEDAVHDSFVRIINKMHLIRKVSCNGLRRYTVLIVRSVAINMIQANKNHKVVELEAVDFVLSDDDFLEDTVSEREKVERIKCYLGQMDIKYSHPMLLRYYYGFTDSETADLLGLSSASTVRSRCYRGKKMILDMIRQAGDVIA